MTIRLLLVDDHAVVRSGLRMLLENERDVEIVGEASSASEAMEAAMRLKPTVILMDIGLPDLSGIEATREIKKRTPSEESSDITEREQEVLTFLAEGASNEEIAASLVISPKTVARHRENIMRKLNLHSRAELVRYAIRKGIIK